MKFVCAAKKEEFVLGFFRNVNKLCSIYVPLNLRNSNNFSIYSAQHSIRAMIQFLLFFPFQILQLSNSKNYFSDFILKFFEGFKQSLPKK